jgi:hypothetical protein
MKYGLNKSSEILNGRLAMIGFFVLILIEICIKKSFLSFIL